MNPERAEPMNEDNRLLAEVVAETLEQYAFLFGEPEEGATVPPEPRDYIESAIGFTGGGERGLLYIAAPASLCREMAGNILGLDGSEVAEDAAMDAIKELANVLVGSFTVRRLGADVPCALDTPTARLVDPARMNALAAREGAACFRVDEHLVVAVLEAQKSEA